jgi:hypothetical protein
MSARRGELRVNGDLESLLRSGIKTEGIESEAVKEGHSARGEIFAT